MLIVSTQRPPYVHYEGGIRTLRPVSPVVAGRRLLRRTNEPTVTVPFLTRAHHVSPLSLKSRLWAVLGTEMGWSLPGDGRGCRGFVAAAR